MNYPSFLVRIGCITYNHAPYIEDAMNGFCMQETTFPFVATIIDDASTDGEQEVINKYLDDNFDFSENSVSRKWETDDAHFIYAQHKENKNCYFAVVLLKYNFYSIKKAKGPLIKEWTDTKYIASCEGDDYWTAPEKLQTQVDFLEQHKEYSMSTHASNYIKNGEVIKNDIRSEKECCFTIEDVLAHGGDFFPTCSYVCRTDVLRSGGEFRKIATVDDYPLTVHIATMGKIHYLPDIMACYRYLVPDSATSRIYASTDFKPLISHAENEKLWLNAFNKETQYKFDTFIKYHNMITARSLMFRRAIDLSEYKKTLIWINFLKLKKEYRKDYFWQMLTYRYNGLYNFACKIKNILNKFFFIS